MRFIDKKRYHLNILLATTTIICFVLLCNFASANVTSTANFSWLPNTEADLAGYKIHYGTSPGGPYTMVVDIGNPAPVDGRIQGSVTGLTEGVTYYFVATAYNEAGLESDYSTQATYPQTTPLVPTGLRVLSIE